MTAPRPRPVALIMGPTGAGKTDLALGLAARLPIDIVSVDSAMVYRGMDVGTGKPSREILQQFPHRLVDILDPSEPYSAGQFVRDALAAINESHAKGRLPLLVGGTMLYFRALRRGLAELPVANPEIREDIDREASRIGWPAMHIELAKIDPAAASRIKPGDGQRIQRAIEVYRVSGQTLSEFHAATAAPDPTLQFATYAWVPSDREKLYAAIAGRFTVMMKTGFLEEVAALRRRGDLHARLPAIRSVGYRQLWEHLEGSVSCEQASANAIVATRHLARRQLVWLRAEREIEWIDALDSDAVDSMHQAMASLCDAAKNASGTQY